MKRWIALVLLLIMSWPAQSAEYCLDEWPLWDEFARVHIQPDGRVIDPAADGITTSEGQSYALFFALVAHDRGHFDRILKWTSDNLAQGDLRNYLPGWKWGRSREGAWQVLDMNPASDADMWMAYSLFHAAALWKDKKYYEIARSILTNIERREVVDLPGVGRALLPASFGFALDAGTWRFNPSYAPVQLLRFFSGVDKQGPWNEVAQNTLRMVAATSVGGLVPDWVLFGVRKGFMHDAERGQYMSYESIRVYLWWAMLHRNEPLYAALRPYLSGVAQFVPEKIYLPERIHVRKGEEEGSAPPGFAAAIAPYRFALYGSRENIPAVLGEDAGYYNFVLSLFGYGWLERRFAFNPDGSLLMGSKKCQR